MSRLQQILSGVLVVQIVLAAIVFWPSKSTAVSDGLLFDGLEAGDVDKIKIEDNSGNEVTLLKNADVWQIEGAGDFPTSTEKVDSLLESVLSISTSRIVTETAQSHKNLSVAENDFLRRVTLTTSDGEEYVLYVGSAPGSNSTHVRRGDSDIVYLSGEITSWEIGNQPRSWIEDLVYVSIPSETIQSVVIENQNGTFEFQRIDSETWDMAGVGEGEEFIQNNLVSVLSGLSSMSLIRPLGSEALPEFGMDTPTALITLETETDGKPETIVLTIGALDDTGSNYYFHASNSDYYVTVSTYSVDNFVTRSRSDFVQIAGESEETEGSD